MNRLLKLSLASLLTLGASSIASAAPVTVTGKYIQMGVNESGALIDPTTAIGIKFDSSGTGNFSSPTDFVGPGVPFAFYAIGVDGVKDAAGARDQPRNTFGAILSSQGSGIVSDPFTITNRGSYAGLDFTQVLYFDNSSQSIHANMTFSNTSHVGINNVAYAVGFDPDQDFGTGNSYFTDNSLHGQGANASVSAYGTLTGYSLTLANTSGWADTMATVNNQWETDPYKAANLMRNDGNGDFTINLGYNLGDFAAGQQKSISYDYTVSAMMVPEPEIFGMMLLGLAVLGLKGRKAKNETFR